MSTPQKNFIAVDQETGATYRFNETDWKGKMDRFMELHPNSNIVEYDAYTPDDIQDTDSIFATTTQGAYSFSPSEWAEKKDRFMQLHPDASLNTVRGVDYHYDRALKLQDELNHSNNAIAEWKQRGEDIDWRSWTDKEMAQAGVRPMGNDLFPNEDVESYVQEGQMLRDAHDKISQEFHNNPRVKEAEEAYQKAYQEELARYRREFIDKMRRDIEMGINSVDQYSAQMTRNAEKQFSNPNDPNPYATEALLASISGDYDVVKGYEEKAKLERYQSAAHFIDMAERARNGELSGFLKGMGSVGEDLIVQAMNRSDIATYADIATILKKLEKEVGSLNDIDENIINRKLSADEKVLLKSYFEYANALESVNNGDAWYKGGRVAGEGVKFAIEFALTGGVAGAGSSAISKGVVTALEKWAAKALAGSFKSVARNLIKKAGVAATKGLADVAIQTALRPSTYTHMAQSMTKIDEEGHLNPLKNAALSFLDDSIETVSEKAGGTISKLLNIPFKPIKGMAAKGWNKAFGGTMFDDWGRALANGAASDYLKAAGFHGMPIEMLEEVVGNTMRLPYEPDALKEMFEGENLGVMALGFLPMTILGGGISAAQLGAAQKAATGSAANLRNILVEKGFSEERADFLTDIKRETSATELSLEMMEIKNELQRKGATEEELQMLADYTTAVAEYQTLRGGMGEVQKKERERIATELESQYGRFYHENSEGNKDVEMAITNDGRAVYITTDKSASGEYGAIDQATGAAIVIRDTDIKASERVNFDAYLEAEMQGRREIAEAERMANERNEQIAKLSELLPNKLNIGTQGEPQMVAVKGQSPKGVTVVDEAGSETTLSWDTVGQKMGLPIKVLSDAQIAEAEAASIGLARAERRAKRAQTDAQANAVAYAAESIAEEVKSNTPAPEEAYRNQETGEIDENAFWDNDPEGWADYNDRTNQDGGIDTMEQIDNGLALLNQQMAQLNKMATDSPNARKAVKAQKAQLQEKIDRITALQQKYVDAAATAEQQREKTEEEKAELTLALRERVAEWRRRLRLNEEQLVIFESIEDILNSPYLTEKDKKDVLRVIDRGKTEGWYNTASTRAFVFLPDIKSEEELDRTIAHEVVTHYGLHNLMGEKAYNELMDKVWNVMSDSAKSTYYNYPGVSNEKDADKRRRMAAEEFVAFVAEHVSLGDATAEQKSIWQRIVDFFRNLFKGSKFTEKDIADIVRKNYQQLTEDADSEHLSEFKAEAQAQAEMNAAAPEVLDDGTNVYSTKTYREGGRDYLDMWLQSDNMISEEERKYILDTMDFMYNAAEGLAEKYSAFGAWSEADVVRDAKGDPIMSVIKANGDYAMNLDFSLVCKKRRALNALLNKMIKDGRFDGMVLREKEIARINQILQKHGFEVACALCFVDAKRYRVASVATQFTSMYNDLVKSLIPKGSGYEALWYNYMQEPNQSEEDARKNPETVISNLPDEALDWTRIDKILRRAEEKKQLNVEEKIAKLLKSGAEYRRLASASDFISDQGFELVTQNNPELLKLYNAKKGTGGPKASLGDVQYLNNIAKSQAFSAEKAYKVGGVRIQSFSDYMPHMFFDYMQMMAELAGKRLPAHAYTKEPAFARLFGMTGMKINLSLVPRVDMDGVAPGLDAEGNYTWAEEYVDEEGRTIATQTFPPEVAFEMQQDPRYSGNVGAIAVGISDEHILKMLGDPNIHFVIPYHKSSLNPDVAKMAKIDQYSDYTNYQTEKLDPSHPNTPKGKLTAAQKKAEIAKRAFDFYGSLAQTNDPKQTAVDYLAHCKEVGLIPKFPQFANNENYYKLLVDFNTYDFVSGEYAPQGAVTLTFPDNMLELIEEGLVEDQQLDDKLNAEISEVAEEVYEEMGTNMYKSEVDGLRTKTLSDINSQFNAELQQQIDGTLPAGHVYQLGLPSNKLLGAGIDNLPIELAASRLVDKSMQENHPYSLSDVENLPIAIQKPLAVFISATHIGSHVILTELTAKGKNFVAALRVMPNKNKITVNQIRSLYPKSTMAIVDWISDELGTTFDRMKMLDWLETKKSEMLSKPQSNSAEVRKRFASATKVVKEFVNPTIPTTNMYKTRTDSQREKLFADAKERFGVTDNFKVAGYMLPDGSLLDFSEANDGGDPNQRSLDHRSIEDVIMEDGTEYDSRWMYLADFMNEGAIRLLPEYAGINLMKAPTKEQRQRLMDFIYKYNGEVILEIADERLNNAAYVEYDRRTSPARIFRDIDGYFNEGIVPQSNTMFKTANNNQAIFVSNAAKAVEGIKMEKATPEQWLKMIEKNGGLKAGEDKWMGLSDWLKASDKKTLTKQEVLDFVNEHMIQIEEVHYKENVRGEIEEAEERMLAMFQPEFDEYVEEAEEVTGSMYLSDHYQYAYNKMWDKYGDDFEIAFGYEDEQLVINDTDAASVITGVELPEINGINSTRLDYTTQGLENKHEIALTVPTIESWNEGDDIHFGDAGEGRAVAWIRFGETKKLLGTTEVDGKKKFNWARVLVIDEIQSKRHQEGREKGYSSDFENSAKLQELNAELEQKTARRKELKDYFDSREENELVRLAQIDMELDEVANVRDYDRLVAERDEINRREENALAEFDMLANQINELEYDIRREKMSNDIKKQTAIPDAPFEKNWHELAMKRMLRYAAENGYDAIAWTKGNQQAERYSLTKSFSSIEREDRPDGDGGRRFSLYGGNVETIYVDENGVVTSSSISNELEGKPLSDIVGKDLAVKMMSLENYDTIDGEDLRIGGEGMKGFYDKMLPAFMNKYGKKWGVKVEDIHLNLEGGLDMHSVPVTEEMKESVMEGQTMFKTKHPQEFAKQFMQEATNEFYETYNTFAPASVIFVKNRKMVAAALGIELEDLTDDLYSRIKKEAETSPAYLVTIEDKKEDGSVETRRRILIFANDSVDMSSIVDWMLFHENTHAILQDVEDKVSMLKLGEWLLESDNKHVRKIADWVKATYEEDAWTEEMLCEYVGKMLAIGRGQWALNLVPEEYKPILNEIYGKFGYRPEQEDGRRDGEISRDIRELQMRNSKLEGTDSDRTFFKTEISPEVRREMDVISAQAIVNGTYLKAPNGKDTKLTPDQWALVRTKNFLDWFGDWINDPENASKVVDENGEPMVVYHGSPYGSITTFDRKGRTQSGLKEFGTYFTTNKKLAELYAYARQQAKKDIEAYEVEKEKLDAIIFNPDTPARIALDAFDELDKLNESQKPRVYEVFLNIKQPKVFDAEGKDGWNGWHKLKQDVGYDIKYGTEAIEAIAGHNRAARMDQSYDGIIAKNIADIHSDEVADYLGDVFLVFDENPNQIKSATDNTGEFSESEDIRFSTKEAVVANTTEDNLPLTRKGALNRLDALRKQASAANEDKLPYFVNDETGIKVFVSNADARHTMMYHNEDQVKVIGIYDKLISKARFVKFDEVDESEAETLEEVRKYACPVIIDGRQYVADMTIKKYRIGNYVLGETHLYDTKLKDDNSAPDASSPKELPILNSQLSSSEGKDTNKSDTNNTSEGNNLFSTKPTNIDRKAVEGLQLLESMGMSFEREIKMVEDALWDETRHIENLKDKMKSNDSPLLEQRLLDAEARREVNEKQLEILRDVQRQLVDTTPIEPSTDMEPRTQFEYLSQLFTAHGVGKTRTGVRLTPQTLKQELGYSAADRKGISYIVSDSEGLTFDEVAEMVQRDSEAESLFANMDTMEIKDVILDFISSMDSYSTIRDYVKSERAKEAKELQAQRDEAAHRIEEQYGMSLEQYNEMVIQQAKDARDAWLKDEGNEEVKQEDDFDASTASVEDVVEHGKQKALEENAEAADTFMQRLRRLNSDINSLRMAAAAQREYDQATVDIITSVANELLSGGRLSDMTRGEVKRLLGILKSATGKQDITHDVERLMDLMIHNQMRHGRDRFKEFLKIRDKKVNTSGVEAQGKLDIEGQQIMDVVRKNIGLSLAEIDNRIMEVGDKLFDASGAVQKNAENELVGLEIARRYAETIAESEAEEKALRDELTDIEREYRSKKIDKATYKSFVHEVENAIRDNKMQRAAAYEDLISDIATMITKSIQGAIQFREAEKHRMQNIQHYANSDLEGLRANAHRQEEGRFWNNPLIQTLTSPLATFEQWLKLFGSKSAEGKGYLYNYFMGAWNDANNKEYLGMQRAHHILDAKVQEIFNGELDRWSDLFAYEKRKAKGDRKPTISVWDDGKMVEYKVTQGNLLYIYMVNKMTDGKMKLRRMGISEEVVDKIVENIDPRFIELADWIQGKFLPELRTKYNVIHEGLFGAPMATIDNYFPLKVLANARTQNEDVATPTTDRKPSTITGSIIKRTKNGLALDVTGANAFDVVLEHIQDMEHWAAFAAFNKDLNTLLSYTKFRNKVQNMSTAMGSGKEAWNSFRKTAEIAAGVYQSKPSNMADKAVMNMVKGLTRGKINFRYWTALKQILSMPAFAPYVNPIQMAKSAATPWKAWNWAIENLPSFQKRWLSRQAGNVRLQKNKSDWKIWQNNVAEAITRWGMTPNAFVDAITCSIGAKAVYDTQYARYIKDGYTEWQADDKAKLDATTAFNATQQSSEGAFLSAVQSDRTFMAYALTVFRNNSFGMQRELVDALRHTKERMKKGYKEQSIEFMKKQMMRDGLTEEQAERAAQRVYRRSAIKDWARIATFGFMMQFLWNLGGSAIYLLAGDDDDEKEEMIIDSAIRGAFGSIEGLGFGNILTEGLAAAVQGDGKKFHPSLSPAGSDLESLWRDIQSDPVGKGVNAMVNILTQMLVGVNPQVLTDQVVAIIDACDGDVGLGTEVCLALLRLINAPQSQIDKLKEDQIDFSNDNGLELTIEEFAKEYAQYKRQRGAGAANVFYSDEQEKKIEDRYIKKFLKRAEELKRSRGNEEAKKYYEYLDTEYKEVTETINELRRKAREAAMEGDRIGSMEFSQKLRDFMKTDVYKRYVSFGGKAKAIERMRDTMKKLGPQSRKEIEERMLSLRRQMVEEMEEANR